MRKSLFLLCIFFMSIFVAGIHGADDGMESFFQTTANPTRNDYSGLTGIEVTMNEETHILALGKCLPVKSLDLYLAF